MGMFSFEYELGQLEPRFSRHRGSIHCPRANTKNLPSKPATLTRLRHTNSGVVFGSGFRQLARVLTNQLSYVSQASLEG